MTRNTCLLIFFLLFVIASNVSFAQIDYKGFPQWSWHKQDSTEYYLYTPSGMQPGRQYPVALFMHGCCGVDDHASLRNAVDPPARMWHNFGANTQKIPTYIIVPATSQGWERHFDDLKKVMDDLVKSKQGDSQRIYICGFSMGGDGTFKFISRYPRYFAAAVIMGMELKGDLAKIKDIPLWVNRGETDWYSRNMPRNVAAIRRLNGAVSDTGFSWSTGINPRFSDFKGVGHGVQWKAASTQDLTGWAYTKINDGNLYPHVWFDAPQWKKVFEKGVPVKVDIGAADPDGSISKIEIRINNRSYKNLLQQPFSFSFIPAAGDNFIEATVFDNKGKTNKAVTVIKTDIPVKLITTNLPYARQGALYTKQLFATGNGKIKFEPANNNFLPQGLSISSNGLIKGVPAVTGRNNFSIRVTDEDGDTTSQSYTINILEKRAGEIIISNALNDSGVVFPVSKIEKGGLPFFSQDDNEINFSETGSYEGLTYIKGNSTDTARTAENYLRFSTDENATIYIAYEKTDNLYNSTIPQWLTYYKKQPAAQIVAQYFYYDLYYKTFPKGEIILPGADEKRNKVNTNYFVIAAPLTPMQTTPEINTTVLSAGTINNSFEEQLTALYGSGDVIWRVKKGKLPPGIHLSPNGILSGTAVARGSFNFTVEAKDSKSENSQQVLTLIIK